MEKEFMYSKPEEGYEEAESVIGGYFPERIRTIEPIDVAKGALKVCAIGIAIRFAYVIGRNKGYSIGLSLGKEMGKITGTLETCDAFADKFAKAITTAPVNG